LADDLFIRVIKLVERPLINITMPKGNLQMNLCLGSFRFRVVQL